MRRARRVLLAGLVVGMGSAVVGCGDDEPPVAAPVTIKFLRHDNATYLAADNAFFAAYMVAHPNVTITSTTVDFRTLMASAVVLESLSRISPAASARGRRRQVLEAVRAAADELSNTPAICRKSYVHDTIVTAFEDGILERFAATMEGYRSQSKREQLLAQVVATVAA